MKQLTADQYWNEVKNDHLKNIGMLPFEIILKRAVVSAWNAAMILPESTPETILTFDQIERNDTPEWKPSLKLSKKQTHEEYFKCVEWWFKKATPEYWNDLYRDYPDVNVKEISRDLYLWLKTHTSKNDFRVDLNRTLRNTWLNRRQKKVEGNQRFNMEKSKLELNKKDKFVL